MDETLQQLRRFMETGEPLATYPNESAQKALEQALKFDKWKSYPEGR
jgi:hypothetical protein